MKEHSSPGPEKLGIVEGKENNRVTDNKQCLLNPPLPLKISVIKWAKFKLTLLPLFQINMQINVLKKIENCHESQPKRIINFSAISPAAEMQQI